MKRIAFVSDAIFPYNKGGKETRLYEISTRLAQKGYDVHIYCMHWWKTPEKIRNENGVTLHAISPFYPLYSGERRSIRQGIMFGLHCMKMIHEDFDVIEVDHMPFFPVYSLKLVCFLKRKKLFATWHEVWGKKYWIEYIGRKGNIAWLIERLSFYLPDKFFSVSDHTSSLLRQYVHSKKIYTVPNGINLELIERAKKSKRSYDVIYAGRLLKHKNVDILINAIFEVKKTFPKIKCVIVGEGPEKNKLISLTKRLHLEHQIRFLNFCTDQSELFGLMKASKIFVLPSSREGFGMSVLEANACGIPVITVNAKDNAAKNIALDIKANKIIQLDIHTLAITITSMLKNGKHISHSQIEKHDWEHIVKQVQYIYADKSIHI